MRDETYLIKTLLKENYPNINFSVTLKQPKNYVQSSDKIVILYDWNSCKIPCDIIIEYLKKNTKNIAVGMQHFPLTKFTDFVPIAYNVKTDTWDDMNLVDFIEVGYK